MRTARMLLIGLLTAAMLTASAGASTNEAAMTKQISFASPERTAMTMSFNEAAVVSAIASLELSQDAHNGYGAMLAIGGSGVPTVNVMNYELGEALPAALLNPEGIPTTASEMVQAGEPVIMHGLQVVPVAVTPVFKDSEGVARVVRNIEFEVQASGSGNCLSLDNGNGWSQAYEPLFRLMVDNLDDVYPHRSLTKPGRFLVLSSTELMDALSPTEQFQIWLNLKRQKGYMVELFTMADVAAAAGGTTENDIREFIGLNYHQSGLPDVEFALMLGDESGNYSIPSHYLRNPEYPTEPDEESIGDNFFFCVDGTSDYMPDVMHSRVSAQSLQEYIAYFAKVNRYETNPYRAETRWFESATFVAGNAVDGTGSVYPVTPVWNMNWAREALLRDGTVSIAPGCSDTFYVHDATDLPGEYTAAIAADIDSGVCAVFYRGWANYSGWHDPQFYIDNVEELVLGVKNPAVFSIVCGTGNYARSGDNCMGEAFLSCGGTTSSPNGAIIFFGASDLHTNTRHNNACLAGIVQGLEEGIRGSAALCMAGKLEVVRQFPLELGEGGLVHFYGLHVLNLLGDPETQLYIGQPNSLTVEHPETLTPGTSMVSITVRDEASAPVENAIVTIRSGNSLQVACVMTDESGAALLPVDLSAGTDAQLLAWKSTYFQSRATIPVASAAFDPYIETVEWDAGADDLPSPGETANFNLMVKNRGTAATTLAVSVASDDPRINVTNGSANSSAIEPGASASVGPFTIELVDGPLPDGALPVLNVQFSDGASVMRTMEVPVAAPDPQIWAVTVNDADGILSPGETAGISVSLVNRGSVEGSVSANVSSFDTGIIITNGNLTWGNLPLGVIVPSSNSFTAQIPGDVAAGRQIVLRFGFDLNGVNYTHKLKLLIAGVVDSSTVTGPDSYGYYAYENIDTGYDATPTYQWIELNPDSAGHVESVVHVVGDDTRFGLRLPSAFRYYGEDYDSLWICSNGWMSFEYASMPEFRNWEIPSPIGPPSMVCPFWDDLVASYITNEDSLNAPHNIYTRSDGNRFIVQWQTLDRRGVTGSTTPQNPSTDFCTFEAILEYSASGDGSIVFQYKQIANVDFKENYGTIGIQNSDHTNGLGLTYANIYPITVDEVVAGRAIRFTTTPPDGYTGVDDDGSVGAVPVKFALHPAFPNPFNPTTELRFDLTQNSRTSLRVYDLLGREAAVLLDREMTAGSHSVQFTAAGLPSGLYFARLTAGENVGVQKLMLVK